MNKVIRIFIPVLIITLAFISVQTVPRAHGYFDNLSQTLPASITIGEWEMFDENNVFDSTSDTHEFGAFDNLLDALIVFRVTIDGETTDIIVDDGDIDNETLNDLGIVGIDRDPQQGRSIFDIYLTEDREILFRNNGDLRDIDKLPEEVELIIIP